MVGDRRASERGPGTPGMAAGGARVGARGRRAGASGVGGGARAAGAKGGAARLQVGKYRLKAARSDRRSCAHLGARVAHVRSQFSGAQRAQGGSNRRARTSEHEEDGLVEVLRRGDVLERGHRLVSLRADVVLRSRRKRWSTKDPAARHRMVSWGRGVVGGLAKGNARKQDGPKWAEADIPALDIADLLGERGGRRYSQSRRSSRWIASKQRRQHGHVDQKTPVRAARR